MSTTLPHPSPAAGLPPGKSLAIGRVTLTVHDLPRVSGFYQQALGLHLMGETADSAELGAGGRVLLELRGDAAARRRNPREAGLFHTAFLLPSRAALGSWVRHAAASELRLDGASDHSVSEAIYLSDPEGNGIEVYADRAPSAWRWQDGTVEMATHRLDLDDVAASAEGPWRGAPAGATVGHIHLQVGAIPAAEAFYTGVLGLEVTRRAPSAVFYAADGYHHHVATNIWNSEGAGERTYPATGLAAFEVLLGPARLAALQGQGASGPDALLHDPWGTAIRVRAC